MTDRQYAHVKFIDGPLDGQDTQVPAGIDAIVIFTQPDMAYHRLPDGVCEWHEREWRPVPNWQTMTISLPPIALSTASQTPSAEPPRT